MIYINVSYIKVNEHLNLQPYKCCPEQQRSFIENSNMVYVPKYHLGMK